MDNETRDHLITVYTIMLSELKRSLTVFRMAAATGSALKELNPDFSLSYSKYLDELKRGQQSSGFDEAIRIIEEKIRSLGGKI